MSSITITGKLVTPDDTAIANATIRFLATSNTTNGAIKGTMSEFSTNATGDYSVSILYGDFKVEFKNPNKDKYITLGNVTIDSSSPASGSLQDLNIN